MAATNATGHTKVVEVVVGRCSLSAGLIHLNLLCRFNSKKRTQINVKMQSTTMSKHKQLNHHFFPQARDAHSELYDGQGICDKRTVEVRRS